MVLLTILSRVLHILNAVGKILLIDDEPEMVRFIHRALENEGHCVVTSTDGAEGLRKALADQPDLASTPHPTPDAA